MVRTGSHSHDKPLWDFKQPETWWMAAKSDRHNSSLWLPLWMHARDTAGVIEYLVRKWFPQAVWRAIGLEEERLIKTVRFLALTHDLGKAIILFQAGVLPLPPSVRERLEASFTFPKRWINAGVTSHALASEAILLHLGCPHGLASIVGAHHGGTQEEPEEQLEGYPNNYFGKAERKAWETIWQDFFYMALQESGFLAATELPTDLTIDDELLLSGLLIMADWIASNTTYFPLISEEETGRGIDYPERIRQALQKLKLPFPWEGQYPFMSDAEFRQRFDFLPYAAQSAVIEAASNMEAPGIMILEAQMGSGKTEAALAAAEIFSARFQMGGVFFGLPTQATANGLFDRLKSWAEQQSEDAVHSIRLAHGMAELNEEYLALFHGQAVTEEELETKQETGLVVHSWFQGRKQALLADFVIGTVDQFLMAALRQSHVMLRHLGLAGKVVIIDECHAYDAYMSTFLNRALNWMGKYRVPVILLSATLPVQRRREMINAYRNVKKPEGKAWEHCMDYPLLTYTDGAEVKQVVLPVSAASYEVQIQRITETDLPAVLQERMREGGCAGIVVNTGKKAQRLQEQLREILPSFDILLFHSQYLQPDRAEIEKMLLARLGKRSDKAQRDRLIVVGTQVLEQSLDIDFDFMVTELCPMDLILQRVGRLHRHKNRTWRPESLRQACCMVLDTDDETFEEGSRAVYGEWLLWRTRRLLPETLVLPDDISTLVQKTYGWEEGDCLAGAVKSWEAKEGYEFEKDRKIKRAKDYTIQAPNDHIRHPERNILDGWLDQMVSTDAAARATVREGDPSIDVLVMVRHTDGSIHFLPWQEDGKAVDASIVPSQAESVQIARQRLRLPGYFGRKWIVDQVIGELETQNAGLLREWQNAPMLKGELILLLNEDGGTRLAGAEVWYDRQKGFMYRREDEDEGNRV